MVYTCWCYLVLSAALLLIGVTALTPAGIQLSENTKLSRRTSTVIGVIAIILSVCSAIYTFFVCSRPIT